MQSYSSKADLWSVGIVAYQLLTGRFPFCDNIRNSSLQDVWKAILSESGRMEKHVNKLRGRVSDDACDFVAALVQRDPSKRFSATQALQHPVRLPGRQRARAQCRYTHRLVLCVQARPPKQSKARSD